jgi:hypothetical protein
MELEDNVRIPKASNLPQGAENKGTHLMQQAEDCHQAHWPNRALKYPCQVHCDYQRYLLLLLPLHNSTTCKHKEHHKTLFDSYVMKTNLVGSEGPSMDYPFKNSD